MIFSQYRPFKINMSFIVMALSIVHYAPPSFSAQKTLNQDTKLYETRFSNDWKLDPRIKKSKIWRLGARKAAAFVSVTELEKSALDVKKSGAIDPTSLGDFAKSRSVSLSRIGITDWQIQSAKNLKILARKGKSFHSFELRGSYRGPSGSTLCYVERQIELENRILQIIGTDHSPQKTPCHWDEISSWMNQVVL